MTTSNAPSLTDLFALLDSWRHLPAYKLEPRADPFFALFLPGVLAEHLGVDLHPIVIPEFPLRLGTLWSDSPQATSKSVKVDYAAFRADRQRVYLVELKTDQGSRRAKQDDYLRRAQDVGLRSLVDGVLTISQDTNPEYVPKYVHLLSRLSELGFIQIPSALYNMAIPEPSRGVSEQLRAIRNIVESEEPPIDVIYIQPIADPDSDSIGFREFADRIERRGELGSTFATYLRRWIESAGRADPRGAGLTRQ